MAQQSEDVVLISEAAEAVDRSPAWIRKMIQEGKITTYTSELDTRTKVSISEIRQKLEPKQAGGN